MSSSLGHEQVVKVLIENRADVNLAALAGITPLHLAVNKGKTSRLNELLELNIIQIFIIELNRSNKRPNIELMRELTEQIADQSSSM